MVQRRRAAGFHDAVDLELASIRAGIRSRVSRIAFKATPATCVEAALEPEINFRDLPLKKA